MIKGLVYKFEEMSDEEIDKLMEDCGVLSILHSKMETIVNDRLDFSHQIKNKLSGLNQEICELISILEIVKRLKGLKR